MKPKDDQQEELYLFAKGLADRGTSYEEIEKLLSQRTGDELLIAAIIKRIKTMRYAIVRKNGLAKIGFGSILLVIGFLITCINFHNNASFSAVMYSTSIVGLVLIFWGLYDIMG